jgi:hypothetical protein
MSSENVALRPSATVTSHGRTTGPSGIFVPIARHGNAAIVWLARQVVNATKS